MEGLSVLMAFPVGSVGKEPACNAEDAGDVGSIPGLERFPGGGHGNPLHILAWKIPWTEELGELQSIGRKELDMTEVTEHSTALRNPFQEALDSTEES